MATIKEIKVIMKEGTTSDGRKFNYFRAVQKDGKLVDCRFTKDVKNIPTSSAIIVVEVANVNMDYSHQFPRLWVKKIEEVKKLEIDNTQKELDLPF